MVAPSLNNAAHIGNKDKFGFTCEVLNCIFLGSLPRTCIFPLLIRLYYPPPVLHDFESGNAGDKKKIISSFGP